MDDHLLALKLICRVCTLRINPKETNCKVEDCCKEIGEIWRITSVWKDDPGIHPNKICHRCFRKVKHHRKGTRKYQPNSDFNIPQWTKHPRTAGDKCLACSLLQSSKSGTKGDQAKFKNLQRTTASVPKPVRTPLTFCLQDRDIFKLYKSPSSSDHRLDINSKLVPITQHHFFTCSICLCILSDPVQSDCQDSFCSECLTKLFQFQRDISIPCPVCFKSIFFHSVRRCPILLLAQLASLNVTCSFCSSSGTLSQLNHHKCATTISSSSAKYHLENVKVQAENQLSPISQAAKTLNELAKSHRAGDPIPSKIAEATEKWVWLKLKASQDKMTQLRTRGRPATIHQVAKPTKTSEEVSAAYRHQRSNTISSFRRFISKGATDIQIEDEALKYVTKLDVDQSLAMMKDMHSSWQALRDQRRYLALLNTGMASEYAMLARRNEIIDNNLICEMVPMVHACNSAAGKSGVITKPTPMVYTRNLCSLISGHLDEHDRLGNLYWHNGLVPEDEIWVKIGADKGGKDVKTMKFNYQILNVRDPNSVTNTVNFAIFEAHDTITNITISMERIREQISSVITMTWRGKRVRILIYGDCEFLCKAYGILGCNATFACPYCEGSYKEWQASLEERGRFPKRTLQTITDNLKIYKDHGSIQSKAKSISKSIVREPLIPVEPENIVVPTLHIGLGIYKNLYDKLESECHKIDIQLYKGMLLEGEVGEEGKDNFEQEVNRQLEQNVALDKKIEETEEEIEILLEDIPLQLYDTSSINDDQEVRISPKVLSLIAKKNQLQEQVKSMKETKKNICLDYAKGPVASGLDNVLQHHHVQRQAYHGKAFVGNHVNKLCKEDPIEDLCEHAVKCTNKMLATNPDNVSVAAIAAAKKVQKKFKPMFTYYAAVHNKVNLGRELAQEEIDDVGHSIQQFLASYRELGEGRVTLKMHILEDHTVDQLERFHAGLGKLNESGGESTHAAQNQDARRAFNLTHQPLERLHFLMKEHLVQVHPKIRSESLKVKNKKRKHEDD